MLGVIASIALLKLKNWKGMHFGGNQVAIAINYSRTLLFRYLLKLF